MQNTKSLNIIENKIRQIINDKGFINIADFMEQALSKGYYQYQNPLGSNNDFITSPEISQLFGEMLGIWCVYNWQLLGSPLNFSLIELGPGNGSLMQDVLNATKNMPGFHQAISSINFVEINHNLKKNQIEKLAKYQHLNIKWYTDFNQINITEPILIIANEFFDCLPIHQYQKSKYDWQEIIVSLMNIQREFCFNHKVVDDKTSNFLNNEYNNTRLGDIIEVSPYSIDLIKSITDKLNIHQGSAAIIDYGYLSKTKLHYNSSLQAIKNHKYHPVLQDIGEADLTAHVNFTALCEAAQVRNIKTTKIQTQHDFLQEFGIEYRASQLCMNANMNQKKDIILSLDRLISPQKMGELFKVLTLSSY